jgi:SAM-dependent methyltransferase
MTLGNYSKFSFLFHKLARSVRDRLRHVPIIVFVWRKSKAVLENINDYRGTTLAKIWVHRRAINFLLQIGRKRKPRTLTYHNAKMLHQRYPKRDIYKYDMASKKERANERFERLCSIVEMCNVKHVVELGGGDGQVALRFFKKGFTVSILDIDDWRDEEVKKANICFHRIKENDKYPIPDSSIDLFLSYATFEHISDPALHLREIIRVTRPGGFVYLLFGPLYNSPWGLHAYRTFYAPYPQFLLSNAVLQQFVIENGIYDLGVKRDSFQYVNGWSLARYCHLLEDLTDRVEIILFEKMHSYDPIGIVYRNLKSFWGHNLSFDELTTENLEILLLVK